MLILPSVQGDTTMKLVDRELLILAVPVFIGHLLSYLFSIADTVFISFLDRQATTFISGIGLTMPVNLLAIALGTGLMVGTASITARALGSKDLSTVRRISREIVWLSITSACILGLVLFFGGNTIIEVLAGQQVDASTQVAAKLYLRFVTPAYVLLVAGQGVLGFLVGHGKTKAYGSAMATSTIFNLILDPICIFVLDLGVVGAALATSLATGLSVVYIGIMFVHAKKENSGLMEMKRACNHVNTDSMKDIKVNIEILRVGFPQALSLLVVSFSFMFLNRIMAEFGPTRLNAWILVGRVEECLLMIGYAVGNATMILSGNFFGAGEHSNLENLVGRSLRTALSIAVLVILPYLLFAPLIFSLFSGNTEVVAACSFQVRAVSWASAGVIVSLVAMSALQGMGKALASFMIVAIRLGFFLIIPVSVLIFLNSLTLTKFLMIFALANIFGGIVSVFVYIRSIRKLPLLSGEVI